MTSWRPPEGKHLFPFQEEDVTTAYFQMRGEGIVPLPAIDLQADMGLGKAEPISEPVLTPAGWVPIGDIRPGDHVISATDGRPARVLGIYPQQSRETYRVTFNDGSWTRCNPDHLWTVGQWINGRRLEWDTLSLRRIMEIGIKDGSGNNRWMIPMTHPVQYPPVSLPIDPYTLGVILGDGSVSDSGYVSLTTDEEIIASVSAKPSSPLADTDAVRVLRTAEWKTALLALGLEGRRSHEKFVPEVYLRAPEADRRALLAGLLDTDGHPMYRGGVEFSSTSLALTEAVVELAESLGGTARWKREGRITHYVRNRERRAGKRSWRVNVKTPSNPFRLGRKAQAWVEPTKYPPRRRIVAVERVEDEDNVCIRIDREDGLYLTRSHIVTHNTVVSMAVAAMLLDDGALDHVLVVAESGKVRDWADVDFPGWTTLTTGRYMGPRRSRLLQDAPQVLVTTYETGRADAAVFKAARKRDGRAISGPGPLAEFLRGKRTLIVFDECTRLRTRSSRTHIAWDYLVNRYLRRDKNSWVGVLALTGTKIEAGPQDHYNVNRIVAPGMSPTVADFEAAYVATRSQWDNKPTGWHNLSEDRCDPDVTPLSKVYEPIMIRRRKSDPEVIDWFPRKVENPSRFIDLTRTQRDFYDAIVDILDDIAEQEREVAIEQGRDPDAGYSTGLGLLRQVAAAPESLLRSEGELARTVVEIVGANALRKMGSAKVDAAVDWLREGGDQQSVVFTFYGQSVLPVLHDRFVAEGYKVSLCHGQMTSLARQRSMDAYKAGDTQVFLSSDAGARGLNLGVGSMLLHYEMPLLHAIYSQRSDRIHRADSVHPSVTVDSFIVRDTVEEAIWDILLRRNGWADAVQDNNETSEGATEFGYLSARDRAAIWKAARKAA